MSGETVAQGMRGEPIFLESTDFHGMANRVLDRAVVMWEARFMSFKKIGFRSVLAVIGFRLRQEVFGQECKPVLIAFAGNDFYLGILAVYVLHFQMTKFIKAHSCSIKEANHKFVFGIFNGSQQMYYLFFREDRGKFKLLTWIQFTGENHFLSLIHISEP